MLLKVEINRFTAKADRELGRDHKIEHEGQQVNIPAVRNTMQCVREIACAPMPKLVWLCKTQPREYFDPERGTVVEVDQYIQVTEGAECPAVPPRKPKLLKEAQR